MTTIHFKYTDSYNNPSRGSLAFMPHRRHAANETEVLPKPFTIPLLNGEVTVNLQPNSSSWVWIITEYFENIAKSFYTTVPDQDGILEHTELLHISPSSLPAPYDAVEPAWWAEQRSLKALISSVTLESQEALTEAQAAIETGRESVEQTQHNASLAKAYANESRESSYESRDYRDEAEHWRNEAQEQADRAASGPESAAQRAEDAAEAAQTSETRAQRYEDDARNHAAEARASENNAASSASTATERASDARNEANRSESEASRAKGYADELMDGPREYVDQAEAARDVAQGYRDETESFRNEAQTASTTAQQYAIDASESAGLADTSQEQAQATVSNFRAEWEGQFTEWTEDNIFIRGGATQHTTYPFMYRFTPLGLQVKGALSVEDVNDMRVLDLTLPDDRAIVASYWHCVAYPWTAAPVPIDTTSNGNFRLKNMSDIDGVRSIYFPAGLIIPWDS
jgi:hypothetical protein